MATSNKRLLLILASAGTLLLIPLIGMQFTSEINWSVFDFLIMGSLLLLASFAIEGILRKIKQKKHRIILLTSFVLIFLLVWAELSVGILGTPFAGN